MRTAFFIEYGCYLGTNQVRVFVDYDPNELSLDEVSDLLADAWYDEAYQDTEGWYGLHGFFLYKEDENEMDEDPDPEELREFIENHTEVYARPWTDDDDLDWVELASEDYDPEVLYFNRQDYTNRFGKYA